MSYDDIAIYIIGNIIGNAILINPLDSIMRFNIRFGFGEYYKFTAFNYCVLGECKFDVTSNSKTAYLFKKWICVVDFNEFKCKVIGLSIINTFYFSRIIHYFRYN